MYYSFILMTKRYIELDFNTQQQKVMFGDVNHNLVHSPITNCKYTLSLGEMILPNINALYGNECMIEDTTFVLTDTVVQNLSLIAQSVALLKPVLLEGSSTSGKTSLVSYLARKISKDGNY